MAPYAGVLDVVARVARVVSEELAFRGCDCILFSGGVDTSFVALSHALYGGGFERGVCVCSRDSPDYEFAVWASERLGLRLTVWDPRRHLGVLWRVVESVVLWLETIDPVEVAAYAAVLAGLVVAKSLGCRCVATGDGGDELFLGYSFLHRLDPEGLEEWRRRVEAGGAVFQAPRLAGLAGVSVALPLYSEGVRRLAGLLATEELLEPFQPGAPVGKAPLRLFLHLHGLSRVAFRLKTPVTSGSGLLELLEEAHCSRPMSSAPWLPSTLHAILQRVVEEAGLNLPVKCRDPERRCPVCGSCMRGRHCPYCGAHVSKGLLSVYRPRIACTVSGGPG